MLPLFFLAYPLDSKQDFIIQATIQTTTMTIATMVNNPDATVTIAMKPAINPIAMIAKNT